MRGGGGMGGGYTSQNKSVTLVTSLYMLLPHCSLPLVHPHTHPHTHPALRSHLVLCLHLAECRLQLAQLGVLAVNEGSQLAVEAARLNKLILQRLDLCGGV